MTADKLDIQSVFQAALAQPSVELRAAYLDAICANAPDARARVEALLKAHDEAGRFLGGAPEATATRPVHSDVDNSDQPLPPLFEGQTPGRQIGPYQLLQRIGEGGMGEVWVAQQSRPIKRRVALKLIKAGMDSKAVTARFEQERQALALMDHPHIAKVLDGGLTEDRRPYFVMELVNGLPLNKFCDEGRLAIRERLELFAHVCQAVQHAHQRGIIHRDLKPSNILVTIIDGRPVPKVIDFGVAKAISGRLSDHSLETEFGAVVGTLEYMSPEQAGYSSDDIDTRSDIYSLGVILYELLTGLRPIDAAHLKKMALTELIRVIREEEPSKPSTRLSTDKSLPSLAAVRQTDPKSLMTLLRGELDWVVMKCLEKQRDRRYESASALGRDIQRYLSDETVEARPAALGYRLRKYVWRHRAAVIAASLTLIALTALTASAVVGKMYATAEQRRMAEAAASRRADDLRKQAESNAEAARVAAHDAAAAKEQVRQVLYAADIRVAWSHWQAKETDKMRDVLQRHVTAAGEHDYRGFEWHYLWRLAHGARHTLRGHRQPVHHLAFAGSSRVLLSGDIEYQYARPGTVVRWRLGVTNEPHTLFTQSVSPERDGYYPGIQALAVSRDGDTCAVGDGSVVRIFDVRSGRQILMLEGFDGDCRSLAYSPDGRHLAAGSSSGEITIWDARTGDQQDTKFAKHAHCVQGLAYSPDGKLLAAGGGDPSAPTWSQLLNGELRVWNVETGELVAQCEAVRSMLNDVCFDSQGVHIAAATLEGTVVVWNPKRRDRGRILRGHVGPVNVVRWLPGGRFLASGGDDGLVRVWDVGREQGDRYYQGHLGPVKALAVSSDGELLASAGRDGTIQLWDPHVDPLRTMISDFPWAIGAVKYSADGSSLMISDYKSVTVCDVERFEKRHVLSIDHWLFAADISVDGKRIASAGNRGADGKEPGIVKVHDVAGEQTPRELDPRMASVKSVSFSPDGLRLACRGRIGKREKERTAITVWDLSDGRELLHRADVSSCVFSRDGQSIALAGPSGVSIVTWEGATVVEKPVVSRSCQDVQFCPDGRRLALLDSTGQLSIWTFADNREQRLGGASYGVTFSADGHRIAAFGESQVNIWDVDGGQIVSTIPVPDTHLAFTPDGRTLVTAGREIRLWQTETGRELLHLGVYEPADVNSLAVSPDGASIAVGGGYRDEHSGVWIWRAGNRGTLVSPSGP